MRDGDELQKDVILGVVGNIDVLFEYDGACNARADGDAAIECRFADADILPAERAFRSLKDIGGGDLLRGREIGAVQRRGDLRCKRLLCRIRIVGNGVGAVLSRKAALLRPLAVLQANDLNGRPVLIGDFDIEVLRVFFVRRNAAEDGVAVHRGDLHRARPADRPASEIDGGAVLHEIAACAEPEIDPVDGADQIAGALIAQRVRRRAAAAERTAVNGRRGAVIGEPAAHRGDGEVRRLHILVKGGSIGARGRRIRQIAHRCQGDAAVIFVRSVPIGI